MDISIGDKAIISESNNIQLNCLNIQVIESIKAESVLIIKRKIFVEISVGNISIDIQLDITKEELIFLEGMVGSRGEKRKHQVARYFFVMKYTPQQISEALGITVAVVYNYISNTRHDMLGDMVNDMKTNKKLINHMTGIVYNLNYQISILMAKYSAVENDTEATRKKLDEARKSNDEKKIRSYQTAYNELITLQRSLLESVRSIESQIVSIWEKFGLTGENALQVIVSGNMNVDIKVEQLNIIWMKLAGIIKTEVPDDGSRRRIFNTLAREINGVGLIKKYE